MGVKIKFIKPFDKIQAGEICVSPKGSALNFVQQGFAEFVEEKKVSDDKPAIELSKEEQKIADKLLESNITEIDDKGNKKPKKRIEFIDSLIEKMSEYYLSQPFFYDECKRFWVWNFELRRWSEIDELNLISDLCNKGICEQEKILNAKLYAKFVLALKLFGRQKKPMEPPMEFIKFKDCIFDINEKCVVVVEHEWDYFFVNCIPHNLGDPESTPTIDKLFVEWVGSDYVDTLYEWIAYCCYRRYNIHVILCLFGSGRNGKSSFLDILTKFLGADNIASTDIDMLSNSRFESYSIWRKLVATMPETNYGTLSRTARLKQLSAGDDTRFEIKGKSGFTEKSYTKLIVSSNAMPESEDTVDGFWRRWLIVKFPNEFPLVGRNILDEISEKELEGLAGKVVKILPVLLKRGYFTNQGTVQEQKDMYISISNPLPLFVENYCIRDDKFFMRFSELFKEYNTYLRKQKMKGVSRKALSLALDQLGFETDKTSKYIDGERVNGYFVLGVCLRKF
jgi:putative DNA primase/helicase